MKIATWNVNSLRVRLPQLLVWLQQNPVDVLALQETKLTDDAFPHAELEAAGYRAAHSGQKAYNGVAILSRLPLTEVSRDLPNLDDAQKRLIAATVEAPSGPLRVISAYVVNGQAVGSEKFDYKLRWLAALSDYLGQELSRHRHLAVVGDFNIAPEDRDVHDPEAWRERILCSTPERSRFRALLELGLVDALRQYTDAPGVFTWWDYRQAAFRRNLGLRIDHVLVTAPLAKRVTEVGVDLGPRRNERPSDHAPVVVHLAPA
ncbi:MAG: exodeoxyribonuclease III [Gammaproteobacteria bacterium]|nr:exodeoxyribonuclease III [Gammaproteobacteria bacterium]